MGNASNSKLLKNTSSLTWNSKYTSVYKLHNTAYSDYMVKLMFERMFYRKGLTLGDVHIYRTENAAYISCVVDLGERIEFYFGKRYEVKERFKAVNVSVLNNTLKTMLNVASVTLILFCYRNKRRRKRYRIAFYAWIMTRIFPTLNNNVVRNIKKQHRLSIRKYRLYQKHYGRAGWIRRKTKLVYSLADLLKLPAIGQWLPFSDMIKEYGNDIDTQVAVAPIGVLYKDSVKITNSIVATYKNGSTVLINKNKIPVAPVSKWYRYVQYRNLRSKVRKYRQFIMQSNKVNKLLIEMKAKHELKHNIRLRDLLHQLQYHSKKYRKCSTKQHKLDLILTMLKLKYMLKPSIKLYNMQWQLRRHSKKYLNFPTRLLSGNNDTNLILNNPRYSKTYSLIQKASAPMNIFVLFPSNKNRALPKTAKFLINLFTHEFQKYRSYNSLVRQIGHAVGVNHKHRIMGIKLQCSGCFRRAQRSKIRKTSAGFLALHQKTKTTDYAMAPVLKTAGIFGVKLWINWR